MKERSNQRTNGTRSNRNLNGRTKREKIELVDQMLSMPASLVTNPSYTPDLERIRKILILDRQLRQISRRDYDLGTIDLAIASYSEQLHQEFAAWLGDRILPREQISVIIDSLLRYLCSDYTKRTISPLKCGERTFKRCSDAIAKELECPESLPFTRYAFKQFARFRETITHLIN